MAKKAAEKSTKEDELMNQPAKQHFVKVTKNKKENARTWVVIYRLVDGPPIDLDRAKTRAAKRKNSKGE